MNSMADKNRMAEMLNISLEELDELVKEGVIREEGGNFPIASNIQAYLSHLKAGADDKETKESYWSEKAKHERAKRKMSELKLKKLKDRMHDAKAVEVIMNDMMSFYRKRTLAIADEVAPKVVGMTNPAEICDILTDAVNAALTDMSGYEFQGEV